MEGDLIDKQIRLISQPSTNVDAEPHMDYRDVVVGCITESARYRL